MIFEAMNSYGLTSMEESGDERKAQIMLAVAKEARESTRWGVERVAAGIKAASKAVQEKWGDAINRKAWSFLSTDLSPSIRLR